MTVGQMELPLSTYSSAADPTPEQTRTHPRQMVIKHCGKQRKHVEHAYEEDGSPFGCPGTPDLRERHTIEQQAREIAERLLERERVRQMELRTYECGSKREFHSPHSYVRDGGSVECPGLTSRPCENESRHHHHRWWTTDAFHWCNGIQARGIDDVGSA